MTNFYPNDTTKNIAFVDGQNLYMGTTLNKENPWKIDLAKFRIYLRKKYKVGTAYYYLGCAQDKHKDLYKHIQESDFILQFRKHNTAMISKKKGNVDVDITFDIMKKMYKREKFDKIILVSGDGDYKMLVDFLIEENKFEKILFPNKKFASSLYKNITAKYYAYLDDIRNKIGANSHKHQTNGNIHKKT